MRVRSLAAASLAASLAVAMVGCTGDAPAEPSDSELTLPTPTASESETDAPLDLESMSDEELLAEAERTYQGWLDDVEEMRTGGGEDYLSLDEWTTEHYREGIQQLFTENLPEELSVQGVQGILGMHLNDDQDLATGVVLAQVCLDNTQVSYVEENGEEYVDSNVPETSSGIFRFVLSPDETHLLIDEERLSEDLVDGLCGE